METTVVDDAALAASISQGEGAIPRIKNWFNTTILRKGRMSFRDELRQQSYISYARPDYNFVGPMPSRMRIGLGGKALLGGLSAWFPIEPPIGMAGGNTPGAAGLSSIFPKAVRGAARGAFALAGPAITAWRLGTMDPDLSYTGKIKQTTKILGEEFFYSAGAAVGGTLGGAVLPGIGHAVGAMAGALILGGAGAALWGGLIDATSIPYDVASSTFNYFAEKGRKGRRLDLGGGISAGNKTRLAATMRQRGIAALGKSDYNARRALGNEAQYMHISG